MDYISMQEISRKWSIFEIRIQKPCDGNRIPGEIRFGHMLLIPKGAKKPEDRRRKENK